MKTLLLITLMLLLAACTGRGRLYNLATGEVVELKYKYGMSGHGSIAGRLSSGEAVTGEYTTVPRGTAGWGQTYAAVNAASVSASGMATSMGVMTASDQRGEAIITGDRGTVIQCEYLTSSLSGHGHGGCRDNKGGLYRIMF